MNLTYRSFAEAIGVSPATVKKWENKKNKITNMTIPAERSIRFYILHHAIQSENEESLKRIRKFMGIIIDIQLSNETEIMRFDGDELQAASWIEREVTSERNRGVIGKIGIDDRIKWNMHRIW